MPTAAEVAIAVAANTRRLRVRRGWSLDQLATRSGVSKGMLVHLEQARTNPSLGTLCKVAETLGVSLAGLVEQPATANVRVVERAAAVRLWTSERGSAGDLLVGSDEDDHLELWRWTLAPGDGHEADGHAAGTREIVHVLSGDMVLRVDGVDHPVPAGAAATFRADRDHGYRNDGRDPVDLVMVVLQPATDADERRLDPAADPAAGEPGPGNSGPGGPGHGHSGSGGPGPGHPATVG
ncbi:MAG TPA: XRE family transcriptional regulator [Acidimicrobiales bacterium]|nr:XRE family transcriptional regulator [Acidimicrobiales bacterium]